MKRGSNSKYKIIIACLISSLLLSGYVIYKPVLKNANKPFIDLSGSIGDALGNAQEAYKVAHPTPDPKPKEEVKPTVTPKPTPPVVTQYDIVVEDENIQINGKNYTIKGIDAFDREIRSSEYDGKTFTVVDDFAESITLREVMDVLEKANKKYKIKTIEE